MGMGKNLGAANIHLLLDDQRLSSKDLAEKAAVNIDIIDALLSGNMTVGDLDCSAAMRIAKVLGVTVDDLLKERDTIDPEDMTPVEKRVRLVELFNELPCDLQNSRLRELANAS